MSKDCSRVDTELTRRPTPITTVAFKGGVDVIANELFTSVIEREPWLYEFARVKLEVIGIDRLTVGEDNGLFEPVLKFPHVAGPRMLSQGV